MMSRHITIVLALAAFALTSVAQERQPRGKAQTSFGGKNVTIDYGRPALKGRTIEELMTNLPEDRVWRAGENQVTTLETETALNIGGETIPAGKYSLYVHAPTEGAWSLLINEHLGVPLKEIFSGAPPELANEPWPMLAGYQTNIADQEVARVEMEKVEVGPTEVFTIELTDGTLQMSWGDVGWAVAVQPAS